MKGGDVSTTLAPASEERAFRNCLGQFTTGVAVVLSKNEGLEVGMTVNSFTSVSLDPRIILVSLDPRSRTFTGLSQSGLFSVSLLSSMQTDTALRFAKRGTDFPSDLVEMDGDVLVVKEAIATFKCSTYRLIEAGDHVLVLGLVDAFRHDIDPLPLVFHAGGFKSLAPEI
jgi:flavin reductase (DIM6/NTAB) family NADH-FMN oxidoreductase RutF